MPEAQCIFLYYLHGLYLLQPGYFTELIIAFITISLQVACICNIAYIPYFITKVF